MSIKPMGGHRRITVMGLGLFGGGVGAARFWSGLGSAVTVTDLRSAEELAPSLRQIEDLDIRFVLGEHRDEDFKNADLVVVNPAVKPENRYIRLARAAGAEIITEVGLVFRLAKGPILGVTGSNGKSTTTALLGEILKRHNPGTLVGGNLGGSLLPELKDHLPSAPLVLELSSFQLHYLKLQSIAPQVAVITNLSPNHLDWHKTVLSYYEDKRNILRFQNATDWAVVNVEDPTLREWTETCRARLLRVARDDPGSEHACYIKDAAIHVRLDGETTQLAPLSSLRLPGRHNELNALQAAGAAFVFSRDADAVREGLSAFRGLPHRLEEVGAVGDVRFINDSIATTPESAICALHAFKEPKVIIAGGYDKGVSFDALGKAILERAEAVVLVGQTATAIREAVQKAMQELLREQKVVGDSRYDEREPLVIDAGPDFDSAVRVAREICPAGGVVLLSPACASYDMFINFEQRGEVFRRLVEQMRASEAT